MPALSIRASFPLGVYIGHRADGSPDPFPDPARLHAALLHAAGTGTTAIEDHGTLRPSDASIRALEWLENNPPEGIHLPERRPQSGDPSRFIYRKQGTVNKKALTNERRVSDGMSINGPVGFRWNSVPGDVAETLRDLCSDVAVLGETESTAVLDHADIEPNLVLDTESSMFTPGGHKVRSATRGRTGALLAAHAAANPGKNRIQNVGTSEEPQPTRVPHEGLRSLRYIRPEKPTPDVPWDQVLLLELGGAPVPEVDRLDWCLTFHRAIISAIGNDVPALVTGVYPADAADRPSNQLAIQYFFATQVARHGVPCHAIGLLIPRGAAAEDLARLATGLSRIRTLRNRHGERSVRFNGVAVDGAAFWEAPAAGYRRLWSPSPLSVTENRSPKASKTGGRQWGLADAGLISVTHVWRREFPVDSRGDNRLIDLHAAATERGIRVGSASLRPVRTSRYVHKSRRGTVPQCWSGLIDLNDLAPTTAVAAIGLSRHLGGGLLEPVDIPESLYPTLMGVDRG
jgi:CRISPR-associated protein Csb2